MVWKIPLLPLIILVIIIVGTIIWLYFSKRKTGYTIQKAKREGKLDAKKGRPLLNQTEFPQYIKKLLDVAEEEISRLAQDWEEKDKKLKASFCNSKFEVENTKRKLQETKKAYNENKIRYEQARNKLEQLEHISSKTICWIVIIILMGMEFPFTSIIFNLFGEARFLTYIMAASVCIAIPLIAHFVGVFLKKGFQKHKYWIVGLFAIILLSLIGISYWRAEYLQISEIQNILHLKLSSSMAIFTFLMASIIIFVVAMLLSHSAHPRDPVTYRNIKWRFAEAFNNLKKSGASLRDIEVEYQRAVNKLELITSLREQSFDKQIDKIPEIRNRCETHIRAYTKINLRCRLKNEYPECLKRKPVFEPLPKSLSILDWDCKEDKQ